MAFRGHKRSLAKDGWIEKSRTVVLVGGSVRYGEIKEKAASCDLQRVVDEARAAICCINMKTTRGDGKQSWQNKILHQRRKNLESIKFS